MALEKIVVATDRAMINPSYQVFSGNLFSWTEYYAEDKAELVAYLNGMLDAVGIRNMDQIRDLIKNGPGETSEWFYAGEPLEEGEFNSILESLSYDNDTFA